MEEFLGLPDGFEFTKELKELEVSEQENKLFTIPL